MLDQPVLPLTADDLKANLGDIQGGLLEEYDTLACVYLFYTVATPEGGRAWLQGLAGHVTTSAAVRADEPTA